MSLPPEVWARVDEIEAKLAELDPILQSFCARRGFRFSTMVDENRTLWPRRGLTAREDIFRGLYLTMDSTVQEVMDRGFYPEMPWSLYADATFMPARSEPTRILSKKVLNAVPYSRLAGILENSLEEGLSVLRALTREDVIARGEVVSA